MYILIWICSILLTHIVHNLNIIIIVSSLYHTIICVCIYNDYWLIDKYSLLTLSPLHQLPDDSASETDSCALDCPSKDRTCAASTCCGPSKQVIAKDKQCGLDHQQLNPTSTCISSVSSNVAVLQATVVSICDRPVLEYVHTIDW